MDTKNFSKEIDRILKREPDPAYARRAKFIFDSVGNLDNLSLLEVGCGRGFYLGVLAELFPKARIVGVELNKTYYTKAKERLRNFKNVKLINGDAAVIDPGVKFDIVLATEVLEHVPNDEVFLKQLKNLLTKQGKIIVTVPNKNYPFLWDPLNWILERTINKHVPSNIWWLAGIWADHQRLYDEKMVKKLTATTKLQVDREEKLTNKCFPFCHFLMYGIGKNIVEKGWAGNFNRFQVKTTAEPRIAQIVLYPIRMVDKLNRDNNGARSVNLAYVLRKP